MLLPRRRGAVALRELDRVALLRDVAEAGFGRRTYPAGTTGVVVDLVGGRARCEVGVFDPPDVLTVAPDDLAPAAASIRTGRRPGRPA